MNAKERNGLNAIWDFFCSLKLTIILLILLSVLSIIGTVIQQNLQPQQYREIYGETTYQFLDSLQFFDMYHSWWFFALLGLFSINLIACSIKRLPRVWKIVKNPVLTPDDTMYRTFSNMEEALVKAPATEIRDRAAAFLSREFSAPVITEEEGKIHLFAQKGAYARFGVYVTHLSILIIFIGAIIGSVWGFKAFVNIPEGQSVSKVWPRSGTEPLQLDFAVQCDDFSVSYYPGTRRPKEFKSLLTILENGKPVSEELVRRPIIVNDPLTYKGITFYQSSYGPSGDPVFDIRVKVRETGNTQSYTVRQGQRVELPGGDVFRVANFSPSSEFGPVARIEVFPSSGRPRAFNVLQAHPEFDARRGGEFAFSLVDYQQRFYTGLQVNKDPGVWVVWIGCILLVVGSLTAFFLSHRRVWITIQPVGDKTGLKIGGTAHRNQPGFELFFEDLKKKFKKEISS